MKKIKETTEVKAAECPTCGDLIFSRARHDYHNCSCGEIAIDGGFDYVRMAFKHVIPKVTTVTVNVSREKLYEDWNSGKDKWGIIKAIKKEIG